MLLLSLYLKEECKYQDFKSKRQHPAQKILKIFIFKLKAFLKIVFSPRNKLYTAIILTNIYTDEDYIF
ncbi:hypothetical protein DJ568_10690 [Mucilaginibacter hurinus]|uniref:Uncharacterized protein n=1 Tax=Mucilaginibacter hurinus TaxID=2201324 RepID=A0A367GN79_9SPHI|nr:hypothetical protein DJ568_10690 [Mucilaginibacter hurinus]